MSDSRPRPSACLVALLAASAGLIPAACGGSPSEAAESPGAQAGRAPAPVSSARAPLDAGARALKGLPLQRPRSREPGLWAATRALERGDLASAQRELLALGEDLDTELARARLAAAEGDDIGAIRRIEALRETAADQARLYATAAEIHAAAGRLRSAEEEVREGLARCGPTPELSRARGVLAIAREGGARVGLNHLLDARASDPELPFLAHPLAQAHLLLARQALVQEDLISAIGHARAALVAEPGERQARLVLADAQAAAGELDEALELYEGLLAEGEPVADTLALLCQRGATLALVEGRRELALERHLRARELGLPAEELGFGATLIAEAAQAALAEGVAAFERSDLERARERFERALRLDPDSLAARNHLAVVRFQAQDYAAAAELWSAVLVQARAEELELPEPVHLNLARALYLDGRSEEVRELLERELERKPDGRWAEATRELLARLEEEGGR